MMRKQRRITSSYFSAARIQYAPLIQKLVFRIGTSATQREELRIRAMEELLRCMICYDGRGSFMTFLYGRLVNIFRHIRDAEQRAKRIRLVTTETMFSFSSPDNDMDLHIFIEELLGCLNPEEHHIVTQLFFKDKTIREVANECGMAHSTVCRVRERAIDRMKQKSEG